MSRGLILFFVGVMFCGSAAAQHTLGVTVGYGSSNARFQPTQETKGIWGGYSAGISWRYYGLQRFVGGFGIDLEFIQQGFSYAPFASVTENKADYEYYTRKQNTIMMPIVWQPHFYLLRNRVRVYIEAAATFSYHLSSTYDNQIAGKSGDYDFKLARDNRWGYGLAGGGGIAFLIKRFELNFRARYYFGYSDLLRNRNKYSGNVNDGAENPFVDTPLRSPLDNLYINIGVSYRFNKEGFKSWSVKPVKREKTKKDNTFNYKAN